MLKRTPSGVTLFSVAILLFLVAFCTLAGTPLWQAVLMVAGVSVAVGLIVLIASFFPLP